MKKFLTTVLTLTLVCAMLLGLCACGGTETKPEATNAKPETTAAPAQTDAAPATTAAPAQTEAAPAEGVDFSIYPADFNDFSMADLKSYLRACEVFVHDDWTIDMSAGDLGAIGAEAGTIYMDMTGGTVMDLIFRFDPNGGESVEKVLNSVKENHELQPDVEGAEATAIDAKLGTFCISYSLGADADHIAALVKAIKDLSAHYGVEPDFVIE